MSTATTERNQKIRALREQGYTLQMLADRYGITDEQVESIAAQVAAEKKAA
jgi:transcriptional regulator